MAAKTLLPGFGGAYTTESIAGVAVTGGVGADTLDVSKCASFAAQVTALTGSPTIQLEQTIDGTNWANLGSAIAATVGTIAVFNATGGPFGRVRVRVTGGSTAATLTFVGQPVQTGY